MRRMSDEINTEGEGIPLVVWNLLGWPRTDLVTARVGLTDPEVHGRESAGARRAGCAGASLHEVRSSTGALLQADIAFVARDVPSLGYTVYRVLPPRVPLPRPPYHERRPRAGKRVLSPHLRRRFGRHDQPRGQAGTSGKSCRHPATWWPARKIAVICGSCTTIWRRGSSRTRLRMCHRQAGQAVLSNDPSETRGTVTCGNVISQFNVSHPFGGDNQFATTVRLVAGLRRIDVHTRIVNQEKSVRYRVLFPTSIREGTSYHEIPFGVIQRPAGMELPAQNWVDWGNAERGVALAQPRIARQQRGGRNAHAFVGPQHADPGVRIRRRI